MEYCVLASGLPLKIAVGMTIMPRRTSPSIKKSSRAPHQSVPQVRWGVAAGLLESGHRLAGE